MTSYSVVQLFSPLFRVLCEKEVEVEYQGKGKKYRMYKHSLFFLFLLKKKTQTQILNKFEIPVANYLFY